MNAMQILWINILMDGPPAQALGLEPADPALTTGKPRSTRQKLLNRGVVARILANATLVSSSFIWPGIFVQEGWL